MAKKELKNTSDDGLDNEEFTYPDDDADLDFNDIDGEGFKDDYFPDNDFNDFDQPMDKYNDLLTKLTNFKPFLKDIVAEWLGLVWSHDEEKYVKDEDTEPIMNKMGAKWCINFLTPYARDNNIITNLDRDSYNYIMYDVIKSAYFNLGSRFEDFGFKYNGDLIKVGNQLVHSVSLILLGAAGNNNYKDLMKGTTKFGYGMGQGAQPLPRKESFFGSLKRAFMGGGGKT